MDNLISLLDQLKNEIDTLILRLDIEGKVQRVDQLQQQANDPDFWSNPEAAQKVMQEISNLNAEIERWQGIANRIHDALELATLEDSDLQAELETEAEALAKIVERMSVHALLSGQYDASDAIFAIHAGAGGTESQDWASMLERMYLRWAQQNGYKVEVLDRSEGEEAGIKSVMMSIQGTICLRLSAKRVGRASTRPHQPV